MVSKKLVNKSEKSVRYFEFFGERSSKFWEVTVDHCSVDVRYGKRGTDGQKQNEKFADAVTASKYADKLIAEKYEKGYLELLPTMAKKNGKTAQNKGGHGSDVPVDVQLQPLTKTSDVLVKVSRTKNIEQQIQSATALKQKIIEGIRKLFPDVLEPKNSDSDERCFLRQIELSAESFDVTFDMCSPKDADRIKSMLSGPFFTSNKYPIPEVSSEMLYPIVQVDLRVASSIIGEPLGDGLLQLWYDINAFKGVVRVIPRPEVEMPMSTEFSFTPPKKFDGFPLPSSWGSDPSGNQVRVMSKYKSTGISSQPEYATIYLNDVSENYELPDDLFALVNDFERTTNGKSSSSVHMFGTFYPIQYSAADVGMKCLFHIAGDWGSSGNAQVFYDIAKNGTVSFAFWDSLR